MTDKMLRVKEMRSYFVTSGDCLFLSALRAYGFRRNGSGISIKSQKECWNCHKFWRYPRKGCICTGRRAVCSLLSLFGVKIVDKCTCLGVTMGRFLTGNRIWQIPDVEVGVDVGDIRFDAGDGVGVKV